MGIIATIVLGLIVGALAKLIMPGKDPGGIIVTILIGVVGSFLGGFIGSKLFNTSVTGFNIKSILLGILGSLILLGIWRAIVGARHSRA